MSTIRYGVRAAQALDMWVKLARAFSTFNKRASDHIRAFGLTQPQFSVLECLGHKGALSIGDLCRTQLVSGGNMTVVVDNLEKEGLVERVRSSIDRRTVSVQLTQKGEAMFHKIFPRHAAFITETASVLTETEQAELARLLKKLGLGLADRALADKAME